MAKSHHGRCQVCGTQLRNYYRRAGERVYRGLLCPADPKHRAEAIAANEAAKAAAA